MNKSRKKRGRHESRRRGSDGQRSHLPMQDLKADYMGKAEHLRQGDLTTLPVGAAVLFDNRGEHADPLHPVAPVMVSNLGDGRAKLRLYYSQCPHCWKHALAYRIYMNEAERLLRLEKSPEGYAFRFIETSEANDGAIFLFFELEGEAFTVHDMERTAHDLVETCLLPLVEVRNAADELIAQKLPPRS